jgi:peptidylprolyl isomerase
MEATTSKWLDEIHLTKDSGVIKRIYRFGDKESALPEKG